MTDKEFFSDFVYGEENRSNIQALRKLVDESRVHADPILLIGPSGVGKTLLLANIHKWARCKFAAGVCYQSGEALIDDVLQRIWEENEQCLAHYFDMNILLVDDLSPLSSKQSTQQEILFFIERMKKQGIPVICTVPDGPIATESIVTRFPGTVLWLASPSNDTVRRLVEQTARQYNISNIDKKTVRAAVAARGSGFVIEGMLKRRAFQSTFAAVYN